MPIVDFVENPFRAHNPSCVPLCTLSPRVHRRFANRRKLEKATKLTSLVGWGTLLVASILASLMLASAGIALLGAIAASIVVAFLQDRGLAFRRLKIYLAVFLIGIGVQGFWNAPTRRS